MNRLFFIAGNNTKKQKGDMITFFLLTLVAAFLLVGLFTRGKGPQPPQEGAPGMTEPMYAPGEGGMVPPTGPRGETAPAPPTRPPQN